MDEDPVTGQGDLFDEFDEQIESVDELIDAGWDPADDGDPADDPDDEEAWWASLPDDIRAELESRTPLPAVLRSADGDWLPEAARAGFAGGGFADAMLPGAGLADLLAAATAEGYGEVNDDVLAGVLRGWQRQVAHGQAQLARAVIELTSRRDAGSSRAAEHLTDEVAIELTLTHRSAGRLVEVCDGLDRLADVSRELMSGMIDWPRACVFVDELAALDDKAAAGIAAKLADQAARWTTGQLRAALKRAVLAVDPDAAQRRQQDARKDTRVEVWHEPSGNAALAGRELPPADAIAAEAALSSDADWLRDNGAPGTLAELRAAAYLARLSGRDLASLLPCADPAEDGNPRSNGGSGSGAPPSAGSHADASHAPGVGGPGGSRHATGGSGVAGTGGSESGGTRRGGAIHLTMPLSALAELTDTAGEVAGYGPADASTCRDLATRIGADPATRWCLTLTSPDGAALAHACAGRRGPTAGQPVISWAAGLQASFSSSRPGPADTRGNHPATPGPPRCGTSSRPGSEPAPRPAAAARPSPATSTTPSRSIRAARPANATADHSAGDTTDVSRRPAGA